MNSQPKYLLEICCYSLEDVITAEEGNAQRVELCNGYAVGGTTPSLGCLTLSKLMCKIPVYVMIRPRGGDFVYSALEKKVMLNDIILALENGANGIVFGALNEDGSIDKDFCKHVIERCDGMPTTFHRAIDLCTNTMEAIDFLASSGIENILTSGGEVKAEQGIAQIKLMHQIANNGIHIMAGSGVNAENILTYANLGLNHFHSSASVIHSKSNINDKLAFNASLKNNEISMVSKSKVEDMVRVLNSFFNPNENH